MTAAMPSLSVHLPARVLTLDEVAALAAADTLHRYELDDGNLLVIPPADAGHATLVERIVAWLTGCGHDAELLRVAPLLRTVERHGGRFPDILVLRRPVPDDMIWIEPGDVALAIEVESPGSQRLDRVTKPAEYARAGIPQLWRVERDPPTVHIYRLGAGEQGEPDYASHRTVLLDTLLS